jgi:hypothetical protein
VVAPAPAAHRRHAHADFGGDLERGARTCLMSS